MASSGSGSGSPSSSRPPPTPVQPGEKVAGKYLVERLLGKGGMGYVMAARHVQLDERVALKFLLPECLKHEEVVNRFAREARAAVKIRSEHVARVTDVGNLDNGTPYLVMEYLEGVDLGAYVERQKGGLPVQEAVDYVLQACVAIAEAHSLGIVHRDLKPSNLFLSKRADGSTCIKVLDFGISKMSDGVSGSTTDQQAMTKTSSSLGSPLYMSPEQMTAAKTVSALTDIWALGVILFELLTGTQPFQGESVAHLFINIATTPPTNIRTLRPDLPQGIESVILRCLEKQPNMRYASTADLARALAAYAPSHAGVSIDRILRIMMGGSLAASREQGADPSVRTLALNPSSAGGAAHQQQRPSATGPVLSATPQPRTQAMQALTPNRSQPAAVFSQTPHPQQTRSSWGTTGPEPPPQIPVHRGLIVGAVVLFFCVIATGGFFGIRHFVGAAGGKTDKPIPSASVSVAVSTPPPSPLPSSSSSSSSSEAPLPAVNDEADAGEIKKLTPPPNPNPNPQPLPPPNPLPIPPTPSVQPQPPPPPQPPTPPKPTPSVNPNCNPNYYFDAEGNKHFKPQCFGKT